MAEPASRLPEEDRPVTRPDLRAQEGIGNNTAGGRSGGATPGTGSRAGGASSGTGSSPGGASGTGGGLYNNDGDSPGRLKDAEESPSDNANDQVGKGYTAGNSNSTGKGKARFRFTRRRAIVGVGITTIVGIAFGFLSISSGPLQLIHLSEILQRNFFNSNQDSSNRLSNLFRYARSGSYGETRVGKLGSITFGRTIDQLKAVGIEFQRDALDHVKSATINTEKLAKSYPELKDMSDPAKVKSFLADKFGISVDQIDGSGTKYEIKTRGFGITASRALLKGSVAALENGKVVAGIKFRVMAQFLDEPSLFHPIKRLRSIAERQATIAIETKDENARQEAEQKPIKDAAIQPEGTLKDKLTGRNLATSALLLTAGMCLVRDVAGTVVAVNRASIVLPTVVQATDKIAVGEQVKSGQDISASQAGGVVGNFTDSSGKTIWQGKALQATAGMSQSGENITHDYQQAFSNKTTAASIKDYLGGGVVGDIACSPIGQFAQITASLGLLIASFAAAPETGGASVGGVVAAKEAVGAIGTAGAMYALQHVFSNLLVDKAIVPAVLSGPVGGNLLAYGARAAAGMGAVASGGVALSAAATASLDKQQQLEDQQKFRSESFFARMFDTKDYQSLTGRLADSLSPSLTQNVASAVTGFMNIGSSLPHTLSSLLTPKAQAANQPYDWGFPEYGIPPSIMNNSKLEDPYDNANKVAAIFDAGDPNGYKDKAKTCFGVGISKGSDGWDVTPKDPVNPNSDDYASAGCDDLSDSNWKRVILFVFDTQTMKAAACYQGDDQSCTGVGFGAPSASTGTSTPAPTTGSLNIQAAQQAAQQASTGGVKVGFALYDSTGKQLGNYSETTQNYGASITKSMLLVAYLKQVGSGTLSSEAKSQLTDLIENSANGSASAPGPAYWVYSHLNHGLSDVKAVASAAGMTGFEADTSDPLYILGQSKITADDFAKFFSKIDTYMPSSQKSFGLDLLSHLSSADQNGLLQANLPGTVYSKEGWKPESSGLGGAPYVVNQAAQFSSSGTIYGVAVTVGGTTDQPSGEAIVKNVVKALIGN
jgi:hypothetical protein